MGTRRADVGAHAIEYKGYLGVIEYDDAAGIFHGEIINLGMMTFTHSANSATLSSFTPPPFTPLKK